MIQTAITVSSSSFFFLFFSFFLRLEGVVSPATIRRSRAIHRSERVRLTRRYGHTEQRSQPLSMLVDHALHRPMKRGYNVAWCIRVADGEIDFHGGQREEYGEGEGRGG